MSASINAVVSGRGLPGFFKISVTIPVFIMAFFSLEGFSQSPKTIDLDEVHQRKVRKYISSREIDRMDDFSAIHASWTNEIRESDYNVNEKIFYLGSDLSIVWECYRHASPVKTWNGKSMRLGLLILKCSNSVVYTDNSIFPEIDTCQVYFLNLRLMKGLFNAPVAFEIIKIDQKEQLLEISYIDNNKSQGKQTIQFFDNGDGQTRIVHRSYFKSNSWLREDFFYPWLHKKFIKEFHGNMSRLVRDTGLTVQTDVR